MKKSFQMQITIQALNTNVCEAHLFAFSHYVKS